MEQAESGRMVATQGLEHGNPRGSVPAVHVRAYQAGAGVDIGVAPSAVDWWNAHPDAQHPGDTNPPAGALVFWGPTAIADRNAAGYPYLGWIQPA